LVFIGKTGDLQTEFSHLEVFEKMTDEWPSLPALGYKNVPIIAFGRRYGVELPPRSSWLCKETPLILPSDGVGFNTQSKKQPGFWFLTSITKVI
jgi:hypothetical protein